MIRKRLYFFLTTIFLLNDFESCKTQQELLVAHITETDCGFAVFTCTLNIHHLTYPKTFVLNNLACTQGEV